MKPGHRGAQRLDAICRRFLRAYGPLLFVVALWLLGSLIAPRWGCLMAHNADRQARARRAGRRQDPRRCVDHLDHGPIRGRV